MRNHKRPFGQRAVSAMLAMLMLAGSAWGADGTTARASATDLWEDGYVDDTEVDESADLYGDDNLENYTEDYDTELDMFGSEDEDGSVEESAPVLEDEDNGTAVTVEGDAEVLSDVESVKITDLGQDAVARWQAMFDAQDSETVYKVVSVYDIMLVDWDGNETEPGGEVSVSLSGDDVTNAILDDRELGIYHAPDAMAVGEGMGDAVTEVYAQTSGYSSVDFTTDSFSEYALVLTGNDTQKQVAFGDNEYIELDKYLKTTGEMNGQNTYDVYLEQAYYDPNPGVKLPNAPIRSDFFMIMDHSASMSDAPCVNLNIAMDAFLKQMQKNNQKRATMAARGAYYDIDPRSVANVNADGTFTMKDAATVKSVMGEHLQYLTGAVMYNNKVKVAVSPDTRVAVYTDAERKSLIDLEYWENNGRYMGKLGTNWGLGHNSTEADYGSGKLLGVPDFGAGNRWLDNMTRTDMATGQVYNWIFNGPGGAEAYTTHRYNSETDRYDGEKIYTPRIVLTTDGAPAGYSAYTGATSGTGFNRDGFDGGNGYDYVNGSNGGSHMYWNVSPLNANNALMLINRIKNLQPERVMSYVTYINMESDPTAKATLDQLAYEASLQNRCADLREVWRRITQRPDTQSLTSIFMMLYSSCAQNGTFNASASQITNYTADAASQGYSPLYFKFYNNASDIPSLQDIVDADDVASTSGASTNGGYANYTSYILDEITDPFEITSVSDIRVYAVPRIPADMNEDGTVNDLVECYADGCPTSVDINADNSVNNPGCSNQDGAHRHASLSVDDKGNVSENNQHIEKTMSFRWGERYLDVGEESAASSTEWIDVTDEVSITVENNRVKVSGYNYEANAVSDFDKDQFRRWPITGNGTVYKVGDYGYKLIVTIPINAKTTFGGNGIRTNNSDVSGFYPSEPTREDLPKWPENAEKNPGGNEYMELYPECSVDLNVTYDIVYDDAIIYAPQTERIHDLVTDAMDMLWYTDAGYSNLQTLRDNAKAEYDNVDAQLKALRDNPPDEGGDFSAWEDQMSKLQQEKNEKQKAYIEASKNLESAPAYIPNGINNAFVDISYEFYDPDGVRVGTMKVPHGKAYVRYADGTCNIDWTFTDGPDMQITKSGEYRIKAVITPVDTVQAPTWHVFTENDSEDMKTGRYDSTQYSPTGSTKAGSQTEKVIEKNPTAQIFVLEISAEDTQQESGTVIDFLNLKGYIQDLIGHRYNKHIVSYRWVCTDPDYATSVQKNEPGYNKSMVIGPDGVNLVTQVPDGAVTDGLVEDVEGMPVIRAEDGRYVPAVAMLTRMCGDLNKNVGTAQQVEQRLLTFADDDNLYDGHSSVTWLHDCNVITEYECNDAEFKQAQKYSMTEAEGDKGKVRFLIHVLDNPNVTPTKSTTTPIIVKGMDIEWQVSVVNNDAEVNPHHRSSEFSLFDIFPYEGDERTYDGTGHQGTLSKTDTYVKSVVVDYGKSKDAQAYLESGKGALYYATDEYVRTADGESLQNPDAPNPVAWTKAVADVDGTKVSYRVPMEALAIRLDTRLAWNESVRVDMVGNVRDLSVQENGDHYINDAKTYNGKTIKNSNAVETEVQAVGLSGTVWVDDDNNGLIGGEEPKKDKVRITLYQEYDPKNPLNEAHKRVVDGITLVPAYDTNFDMYSPVITGEDGNFKFEDIQQGDYYIIADLIPEEYEMTKKHAGEGDANSARIDSEAEEGFIDSSNKGEYANDGHSAWIKKVHVGAEMVTGQNFGLRNIKGSIRVGKIVSEIYYPSSMTDEEKATYRIPFTFVLKNLDNGQIYKKSVYVGEDDHYAVAGMPQVWTDDSYIKSFYDLPLGTYELSETESAVYHLSNVRLLDGNADNVKFDKDSRKATIKVTPDSYDFVLEVTNGQPETPPPPGGDENGVRNLVNMKTPVKLELKYVGPDPISDKERTDYTFTASDFDPDKGGDMIVTYDDGSTISISEGNLRFDQVTLSPATVTNDMNTSGGNKLAVTGYYSERGHLVTDSFRVGVDLKPVHKFFIDFNGNGSTFKPAGDVVNHVRFAYDVHQNKNMVTSGTYKDVPNGGLTNLDGFRFAGWNTKFDGTGTQYGSLGNKDSGSSTDALAALDALGLDESFSGSTLYARWRTGVTFNANGGTISSANCPTNEEKALNGLRSGVIEMDKNSLVSTNMSAAKSGYRFVMWNTKPDGTGYDFAQYNARGGVQGPTTFYAIYYHSDYAFTGTVQTFTAPVSGWYKIECYGGSGGDDGNNFGRGGYTRGNLHFNANQTIYVMVGDYGGSVGDEQLKVGWNGGGAPGNYNKDFGWLSGGGGGATDLRLQSAGAGSTNWEIGLYSRIIVAGGGGGGCGSSKRHDKSKHNNGAGDGGGLTAASSCFGRATGGGQTFGGRGPSIGNGGFGYGCGFGLDTPGGNGSGGGGGWYGGVAGTIRRDEDFDEDSGSGGSSYISGYPGCAVNHNMQSTNGYMRIGGNQAVDKTGHAHVYLLSRD